MVIPCRNEEHNIIRTIQGIQKTFHDHGINYEVIVVNDGSTDATADLLKRHFHHDDRIRVIPNEHAQGIGNAIRVGLDAYQGDYVIIAMADASDDPEDMVRFIREVKKGSDCCFGHRWIKGARVENYPKFKLLLNRLANGFISFLFQMKYTDVTNAFKCYSREVIEGIKPILSQHFNVTVELPLKAISRGFSFTVIPNHWKARINGRAKWKMKEMGSRYLLILLYIWLEKIFMRRNDRKIQERGNASFSHRVCG